MPKAKNFEIIKEKDENGNVIKATLKMLDVKQKESAKETDIN